MNAEPTVSNAASDEESAIFFARLTRLLGEVEELNRQLERIEAEAEDTISRAAGEGYGDFR